MSERTDITNFLLLSVLAGILLVSGSLQCAFDCLARGDSGFYNASLYAQHDRVDSCHPAFERVSPTISCLNKACHQRLPLHHDLGGPEIYHLNKLAQPLYSSSRQPNPQYRAGSAVLTVPNSRSPQTRLQATTSPCAPYTLHSIRTTVILC